MGIGLAMLTKCLLRSDRVPDFRSNWILVPEQLQRGCIALGTGAVFVDRHRRRDSLMPVCGTGARPAPASVEATGTRGPDRRACATRSLTQRCQEYGPQPSVLALGVAGCGSCGVAPRNQKPSTDRVGNFQYLKTGENWMPVDRRSHRVRLRARASSHRRRGAIRSAISSCANGARPDPPQAEHGRSIIVSRVEKHYVWSRASDISGAVSVPGCCFYISRELGHSSCINPAVDSTNGGTDEN